MIGDPKEKKEYLERLIISADSRNRVNRFWEFGQLFNIENFFQLISICLQIILGLSVVTAAILGLIQPLWLATMFGIFGSATAISGVYIAYRFFTRNQVFDSLITRAIRRVIQSQN